MQVTRDPETRNVILNYDLTVFQVYQMKAEQVQDLQTQKGGVMKEMNEEKLKVQPIFKKRQQAQAELQRFDGNLNKSVRFNQIIDFQKFLVLV